jgi:hypothetical protein
MAHKIKLPPTQWIGILVFDGFGHGYHARQDHDQAGGAQARKAMLFIQTRP